MRRCLVPSLVLALLIAVTDRARADEPRDETDGPYGGYALLRVGAATAPFHTEALSEVESEFTQARLMIFGAHVRLTPRFTVGARWPTAPSTVKQPAGSYVDDKALGNPELFVEDRSLRVHRGNTIARAILRAGIALPLAEHGSPTSLVKNRTLAISDALDGWRNPELYTPGVVPITLSGRLGVSIPHWQFDARAKLPLAIRIHDADLPAEARTRAIGFMPHVELGAAFWPRHYLALAAGAHAVVSAPAAVAPPPDAARSGALQLGIEPRLLFLLGQRFALTADVSILLGGPLDGTLGFGLTLAYHR